MFCQAAEFVEYQSFGDILNGKRLIAAGVGPRREAIVLAADSEGQAAPYAATIIRLRHSFGYAIDLPRVEAVSPHVQPLDDDWTLIVAPRCECGQGSPGHNATIYDEHGKVVRRLSLGDGIEGVQVSLDQRIWVSYFDEGVLGSLGGPCAKMGADGLLCFDTEGQIAWRFHAPGGFDPIFDCYAMNVANDSVWVCYHSAFPVVQITSGGGVRGWENTFEGARALAVDDEHVLLWGGYGDESDRCVVQTIRGDRLESPQSIDLRLPGGGSLAGARISGRDSILHAFVGATWYQFDLRWLSAYYA